MRVDSVESTISVTLLTFIAVPFHLYIHSFLENLDSSCLVEVLLVHPIVTVTNARAMPSAMLSAMLSAMISGQMIYFGF